MDRSRYRIIEKNEDIWRIFCGIVIYVGLLCILPWGNFGLWNMLDYASLKSEEVREHAREVKVQWSTEMQVVDSSGKEVMRKLRAGTIVKVLAICYELPDEPVLLSYKPWAKFQIELQDGTRGIAELPEAATGLEVKLLVDGELKPFRVERVERLAKNPMKSEKKQSDYPYLYHLDNGEKLAFEPIYWPIKDQIPIYNPWHEGELHTDIDRMTVFVKDLEGLKGDSLNVIEDRYEPAESILVKGNKKYAYFPGQSIMVGDDSISMVHKTMFLVFENDTLADYQLSEDSYRSFPQYSRVLNAHIRVNPHYMRTGYYEAFPFGNFVNSRALPLWAARGIAGVVDTLMVLLLAFLVPVLMRYVFLYIRPFPNKLVKLLSILGIIVVFHLYILFFSTPSINIFFVYVGIAVAWMLMSVEVSSRCPRCHRVNAMEFLGNGDTRTVVSVDEHDESKLLARKVERHGDKLVITDTVDEYVEKETTVTEHYYSYYRCKYCGNSVRTKGTRLVGTSIEYRDRDKRK